MIAFMNYALNRTTKRTNSEANMFNEFYRYNICLSNEIKTFKPILFFSRLFTYPIQLTLFAVYTNGVRAFLVPPWRKQMYFSGKLHEIGKASLRLLLEKAKWKEARRRKNKLYEWKANS